MLEQNTRNIKGTEYIAGGLLIRPDFSLMGQAAFLITTVIASGGGGGGLILFVPWLRTTEGWGLPPATAPIVPLMGEAQSERASPGPIAHDALTLQRPFWLAGLFFLWSLAALASIHLPYTSPSLLYSVHRPLPWQQ